MEQFPVQRRILRPRYSFIKILATFIVFCVTVAAGYLIFNSTIQYLKTQAISPGKDFKLVNGFEGVGIVILPNWPLILEPFGKISFTCPIAGTRIIEGKYGGRKVHLECRQEQNKFIATGEGINGNFFAIAESATNTDQPFRQIYSKTTKGEINFSTRATKKELQVFGKYLGQDMACRIFRRLLDKEIITVFETIDIKNRRSYANLSLSEEGMKQFITGFVGDNRISLTIEETSIEETSNKRLKISGLGIDGPTNLEFIETDSRWSITGNQSGQQLELIVK